MENHGLCMIWSNIGVSCTCSHKIHTWKNSNPAGWTSSCSWERMRYCSRCSWKLEQLNIYFGTMLGWSTHGVIWAMWTNRMMKLLVSLPYFYLLWWMMDEGRWRWWMMFHPNCSSQRAIKEHLFFVASSSLCTLCSSLAASSRSWKKGWSNVGPCKSWRNIWV